MKVPTIRFEEELLTDAPLDAVVSRLQSFLESPTCLPRFRSIRREGEALYAKVRPWPGERDILVMPLDRDGDRYQLQWFMTPIWGLEEQGGVEAWPEAGRTRIRLWGRLKGWPSLLMVGAVRFVSDHSIQRFLEKV